MSAILNSTDGPFLRYQKKRQNWKENSYRDKNNSILSVWSRQLSCDGNGNNFDGNNFSYTCFCAGTTFVTWTLASWDALPTARTKFLGRNPSRTYLCIAYEGNNRLARQITVIFLSLSTVYERTPTQSLFVNVANPQPNSNGKWSCVKEIEIEIIPFLMEQGFSTLHRRFERSIVLNNTFNTLTGSSDTRELVCVLRVKRVTLIR